jgi:hypothetical protein
LQTFYKQFYHQLKRKAESKGKKLRLSRKKSKKVGGGGVEFWAFILSVTFSTTRTADLSTLFSRKFFVIHFC